MTDTIEALFQAAISVDSHTVSSETPPIKKRPSSSESSRETPTRTDAIMASTDPIEKKPSPVPSTGKEKKRPNKESMVSRPPKKKRENNLGDSSEATMEKSPKISYEESIERGRALSRLYSQRNRDKQKRIIEELTQEKLQLGRENGALRMTNDKYTEQLRIALAENQLLRQNTQMLKMASRPVSTVLTGSDQIPSNTSTQSIATRLFGSNSDHNQLSMALLSLLATGGDTTPVNASSLSGTLPSAASDGAIRHILNQALSASVSAVNSDSFRTQSMIHSLEPNSLLSLQLPSNDAMHDSVERRRQLLLQILAALR